MLSKEEIKRIALSIRIPFAENKFSTNLDLVIDKIRENYGYEIELDYGKNISADNISMLPFFVENSGMVEKNGEKGFKIILSPYEGESRKRFTISHEIGHIVLGHLNSFPIGDKIEEPRNNFLARSVVFDKNSTEEIEANDFAAELLMPEFLIEEYFQNAKKISIKDIELASTRFSVSKAAMMVRLNYLEYKF